MWIFAYGSLIWRPAFVFLERRRAFVEGWARRFWQGSPDHRGVPDAPGRVVTLVPEASSTCGGVAYRVDERAQASVLAELDHRERAGFARRMLPVRDAPGAAPFASALTYVADPENPHFLGPLDEPAIAAWVRTRHGPSGSNVEYVVRLHDALRDLEVEDRHVGAIAELLRIR